VDQGSQGVGAQTPVGDREGDRGVGRSISGRGGVGRRAPPGLAGGRLRSSSVGSKRAGSPASATSSPGRLEWQLRDWLASEVRKQRGADDEACADAVDAAGIAMVRVAASRAKADDEQRVLRRELAAGETGRDGGASLELGVGGAGRTGSLKCLHAHAGFALARPGYELGERIVAELDPLWPDRCCTEPG